MKRVGLAGIFCLLCSGLFAQEETLKKNLVTLNVLESFYTGIATFPTIQVAYERVLTNRVSIIPEIGIQLYELPIDFTGHPRTFVNPSGVKILLEGRYYYKTVSRSSLYRRFPVGVLLFFRHNQFNSSVGYEEGGKGGAEITDEFWGKKSVIGFNLTHGIQFVKRKGLVVELFWGTGARYRQVRNYEMEYDPATDYEMRGRHQFFSHPGLSQNNGIGFSMHTGVKAGWGFK